MIINTGETIVEQFLSLDSNNNPVSGATFNSIMLKDGAVDSSTNITIALINATTGIFGASWSAASYGDYQIYIKNNITNVVYMSDKVNVEPNNEFEQNIFLGL